MLEELEGLYHCLWDENGMMQSAYREGVLQAYKEKYENPEDIDNETLSRIEKRADDLWSQRLSADWREIEDREINKIHSGSAEVEDDRGSIKPVFIRAYIQAVKELLKATNLNSMQIARALEIKEEFVTKVKRAYELKGLKG